MHPDKIFIYVNGKRVSLTQFREMAQEDIKTVYASGCTALTALKADAAKTVDVSGCIFDKADPGFRYISAGTDSRGYLFEAMKIRGQ